MNTKKPLVSIIMNCYNGEKYLKKAIKSVLSQTYENWELVFWDNQSVDNSAKIFLSYTDNRLKYHLASEHTPLYAARNLAIHESSGEFIAFLDVDDYWYSNKLEKQIPLFDNKKTAVVFGNYFIKNENAKTYKIAHNELYSGAVLNKLLAKYVVGLVALVIRKSSVDSMETIFNPDFMIIGDFDLVIRLSAEWDLDAVTDAIAVYRWHGENLSSTQIRVQIEELEKWIKYIQLNHQYIYEQNNFNNQYFLLKYLKGLCAIEDGNYYTAIRYLLMLPLGKYKIKLFTSLILPSFILNKLRTFS